MYRNAPSRPLPEKLKALQLGFESLNLLLRDVCIHMFPASTALLKGALDPVETDSQLLHSSFLEVFRYDCSPPLPELLTDLDGPRYRISCGEHRDTSLLTAIPPFQGNVPGLECYNWSTSSWHCEDAGAAHENEVLIFAGELFGPFFQCNLPALNHRVVTELRPGEVRYSCPSELLPFPTDATRDMLTSLGKGLVSVNY